MSTNSENILRRIFGRKGSADASGSTEKRGFAVKTAIAAALIVVVGLYAVAVYWDSEPAMFDVKSEADSRAGSPDATKVVGYTTAATLAHVVEVMLNKRGGYLSNDITPPSVFMDNMPNWEYGVLVQSRDLSKALRNEFSVSRSQSEENPYLAKADPQFNVTNDSWAFPASESAYREGVHYLDLYMKGLRDQGSPNTQFYARADNLNDWLGVVSKRLGSLSQRLSASVGQYRVNTDLAGEPGAKQATHRGDELYSRTPWLEIDDVFYEARGSAWALVHFLKAIEIDFHSVLADKNALVSLRQIIRELEATQRPMYSPIVLNGSGFGFFANHSLTLASYISRANAAVIDLRNLLSQG